MKEIKRIETEEEEQERGLLESDITGWQKYFKGLHKAVHGKEMGEEESRRSAVAHLRRGCK